VYYKCKAGSCSPGRDQRKASVVLCREAESSASVVQSIRERLLMTENGVFFVVVVFSCTSYSLCMKALDVSRLDQKNPLYKASAMGL